MAIAVFVAGVSASFYAWHNEHLQFERVDHARFEQRVNTITNRIHEFHARVPFLFASVESFLTASDGLTQEEWDRHIAGLIGSKAFPGLAGGGYLAAAKDGFALQRWYGEGPVPGSERIRRWGTAAESAGNDGYSAVMEKQAATDEPARLALIQALHASHVKPGWIVLELRAPELIAAVFPGYREEQPPLLQFRVFAGSPPEKLIFSNVNEPPEAARFSEQREFQAAEKHWTVAFSTTPAFDESSDGGYSHGLLLSGVLLSMLLSLVVGSLSYTRRRAVVLAEEMSHSRAVSQMALIRIQKAVECSSDAIAILTPAGELLYLNPAFEAMYGYSGEELAATGGVARLAIDENLGLEILQKAQSEGKWLGEVAMRAKDGREFKVALRLDAIVDDTGEPLGLVGINTDISARVEMEQALREARDVAIEASRLKSAFLSNMSHEIRTPMNGVIGMTKLLLTTDLTPEQREYAQLVGVAADSLMNVINDILDFSKIEAGKLSLEIVEFDLWDLLHGVRSLMSISARTKGLPLELEVAENVPRTIVNDPLRLRQVLLNLIGNAIKFTGQGKVAVSARMAADVVEIEVTDTGIGIQPDLLPTLFQPFTQADASTTRRFGGTGLGLAISRQLVDLMGGEIGVRSVPNQGSTFWITVPVVLEASPEHREFGSARR